VPGHAFSAGDTVTLRTVEPEDDDFLARHRNDPSIRRPNGEYDPMTSADVVDYRESAEDGVTLLACVAEQPVGLVFLFEERPRAGIAELGYWIAPDERRQGYATEAARLLCAHAFRERALRKLVAHVVAGNDGSLAVLDTLGFTEEGCHRRELFVDGAYRDLRRFGLFAEAFDADSHETG